MQKIIPFVWYSNEAEEAATFLTEVADVAAFVASDRASAMTATAANVSCGSAVD